MRVTYYGELDPFSGSVAQGQADLVRAVDDLQLALLFSDVVIVPPGNLLEHALTLPAFEARAPFVAAGRLTTTTDPSSSGPHALIDERVDVYLEERARGSTTTPMLGRPPKAKPLTIRRHRSIEEVRGRWHAVLPASWTLARDVGTQITGFAERLQRFCEHNGRPSAATPSTRCSTWDIPCSLARSGVAGRRWGTILASANTTACATACAAWLSIPCGACVST